MNHNPEILFLIEESDEGGYVARGVGADIVTEADTLPELRENIREAIECHFEEAASPKIARLHFVREEILTV